jgi:hypothetical protein
LKCYKANGVPPKTSHAKSYVERATNGGTPPDGRQILLEISVPPHFAYSLNSKLASIAKIAAAG